METFVHDIKCVHAELWKRYVDAKYTASLPSTNSIQSYCFDVLGNYEATNNLSLMSHIEQKSCHLAANSLDNTA